MQNQTNRTRRDFFRLAAAGSAAASVAGQASLRAASGAESASGNEGRPLKLALASYTLRKFGLDKTLAMTRRVGLDAICLKSCHLPLDASAEQIAGTAARVNGAGILLYGGGVIAMPSAKAVERAFAYAKAAGMVRIIGTPAPDLLPLVNEKVQQFDIQVCIHNHGPGDGTYPTPDVAYEKIKRLDKRIGLCHDVGHTLRYGKDPVVLTWQCADRIFDVHMKDVTEATKAGRGTICGRGVIDVPGILRALIAIDYDGFVAFEYEAKADADDPLPGLAESVGYVRGVLDVL